METLFNVPVTPGAKQLTSMNEVLRAYLENTSTLTTHYLKHTKHEINQGKGAALPTGIAQATGKYLLAQDADQQYVVYGSRSVGSHLYRILFFWQSTRT